MKYNSKYSKFKIQNKIFIKILYFFKITPIKLLF
jgi:hypothetical protein